MILREHIEAIRDLSPMRGSHCVCLACQINGHAVAALDIIDGSREAASENAQGGAEMQRLPSQGSIDQRPVWITPADLALPSIELRALLVERWAEAPADAVGVSMAALRSERLLPVRSYDDRAVHVVMRALEMP